MVLLAAGLALVATAVIGSILAGAQEEGTGRTFEDLNEIVDIFIVRTERRLGGLEYTVEVLQWVVAAQGLALLFVFLWGASARRRLQREVSAERYGPAEEELKELVKVHIRERHGELVEAAVASQAED